LIHCKGLIHQAYIIVIAKRMASRQSRFCRGLIHQAHIVIEGDLRERGNFFFFDKLKVTRRIASL